ncbi:replication factor A [Salinarchaeum sp. Harcht-Bsk1]|uniref:Single-stranded DNA binding protein n=1 Tax=Salinarchaeum sp. Harcht-Bsk1 TaxID=1333523 RepID=UPI0003424707|nr:Single-stranded DNA binding protein [Salinarchaeum sp. Harcht-Bsk1]AGN00119.1 replication factor A [Salinarchaeum sp. Harcht-Bsk1]
MSLDDHAEDLASDLGVDKEEVKADLENLVEYSVPVEEAKESLRRKYGDGGGGGGSTPSVDSIAEIDTETGSVNLTARVLTIGDREISIDGERQVIREGDLADDSGKIEYTAWEDFGLEAGDTITIGNAGIREFRGNAQVNLGSSTTVTFEEDDLEVPYEIGPDRSLADLQVGDAGRAVEVLVEEVETRTIDGRDGETTIKSGVFGDESGRLPFTDWGNRDDLEEGTTIRAENVHVREFRGVPEVSLSERATVQPIDRDIEVGEEVTRRSIREAVATGGIYDVEVVGNVVDVRDGSGLIERCPECGRVIQNGQCRSHGQVEGEDDLRVRAILDDGTDTVTIVLGPDKTEEIYGGGLEKAREAARDAMDQSVVGEQIASEIVGREYRVRGHLSVDDYGATLDASEFEETGDEPADRAAELLAKVGR